MRKLSNEEMELVSGGLDVGDVSFLSGNGVGSGNHASASNIGNGNMLANDSGNGSANGWGIGNYSLN
jgi:hypothetical protein